MITVASTPSSDISIRQSNLKAFAGVGAATVVDLWSITGTVDVLRIWGVVTTTLANKVHTAAYFRLSDGTLTPAITLATGVTLSGLPVGTTISKDGLAAAALTLSDASAGVIVEPAAAAGGLESAFRIVQKSGTTTKIQYVYSTTDNPTSGGMRFWIEYQPMSSDAAVAAL